jgi:hypothetical protein
MPLVRDFRIYRYHASRIVRCGQFIGRGWYWKLYVLENTLRMFIHSSLSAQISPQWWDIAVDPQIRKNAERLRHQYAKKLQHTLPGLHDVYYVFLSDLNRIISANSNLLSPVAPDIDQWIAKIEEVRIPRNLVGHMNFPDERDRKRIDLIHSQAGMLISYLEARQLPIQIP